MHIYAEVEDPKVLSRIMSINDINFIFNVIVLKIKTIIYGHL